MEKDELIVASTSELAAAGESHVLSRLLLNGFIAALAPTGVRNTDIVITNDAGDRFSAIQVKSRRAKGSDGGWHMGKKHEQLRSPSLFYCFVDFGKTFKDQTKTWVIPSLVVAEAVATSHAKWLATPGKKGQPHNDNDHRRFCPSWENLGLMQYRRGWLDQYFENWSLLDGVGKAGGAAEVTRAEAKRKPRR